MARLCRPLGIWIFKSLRQVAPQIALQRRALKRARICVRWTAQST